MVTAETISDLIALDPSESTLLVRLNPANLSSDTLEALKLASESTGSAGDKLRAWLRERVLLEIGRRTANDEGDLIECECWLLPWHKWNDDELRGALAASYTWLRVDAVPEAAEVFDAIHAAVVTVVCCRLSELHTAIENSARG